MHCYIYHAIRPRDDPRDFLRPLPDALRLLLDDALRALAFLRPSLDPLFDGLAAARVDLVAFVDRPLPRLVAPPVMNPPSVALASAAGC